MSLRGSVDRERIRLFLKKLSERFRRPARVYLVGGSSVVFEKLRHQTLEIDVVLEVPPADHGALLKAVCELKDELSVNVEEASPADFIPLPSGSESRHVFVERFGSIDVFHFDPYACALSKIERGRTQDMDDVLAMLKARTVEWDRLSACFCEILPSVATKSLKASPARFERNFKYLETLHAKG